MCVILFFRYFQSTSGQFNPVFRSSSTRGSPRLGTAHISQPIFVESSATQACKPLTSAPARPHAGALRPSRAVPEASSCTRASSCHMTLPFLVFINLSLGSLRLQRLCLNYTHKRLFEQICLTRKNKISCSFCSPIFVPFHCSRRKNSQLWLSC